MRKELEEAKKEALFLKKAVGILCRRKSIRGLSIYSKIITILLEYVGCSENLELFQMLITTS